MDGWASPSLLPVTDTRKGRHLGDVEPHPMASKPVLFLEGSSMKVTAVPLEPEVLQTLDSLYAFYHRQWSCYSHMHRVFKLCQTLLNRVALLKVAAGMVASSIFENTIVVTCLTSLGYHHHPCGATSGNFPSRWTGANLPTPTLATSWLSFNPDWTPNLPTKHSPFEEDSLLIKM